MIPKLYCGIVRSKALVFSHKVAAVGFPTQIHLYNVFSALYSHHLVALTLHYRSFFLFASLQPSLAAINLRLDMSVQMFFFLIILFEMLLWLWPCFLS